MKTKDEIKRRMERLKAEIHYLETMDTGCHTCLNFSDMSGGCRLAAGEKPPAEVIRSGCDSWEYDDIPF